MFDDTRGYPQPLGFLPVTSGSVVSMFTNFGSSRESSAFRRSVRTMLVPRVLPCSKPWAFEQMVVIPQLIPPGNFEDTL